jgi:hypothetical protein
MSEYAQRESSTSSGSDSSSETASAAQSAEAGQSNQAAQDELNSVRTVVGDGGYTYQQSADGSITIIAGPTSVGVQLGVGQPGWQAITDEIGAWSGASPAGAVEQSTGPSAAAVVSSRTVEGAGGYVYQQFQDGSIVIVGGPTSVGVKLSVGKPGWQAITGEIGPWVQETAPPAVAEGVDPGVVENATEESSGVWMSDWLDSIGDAAIEIAGDIVEEVSSWWESEESQAEESQAEEAGDQAELEELSEEEQDSVDILLDVPWFSQFYYYAEDGSALTSPSGHGATQANGEKALTMKNSSDKAVAEGLKPWLFEPGNVSCCRAAKAMVGVGGGSAGGGYSAIQVFYDGDETDTDTHGSRQYTELDRSDPERLAEISERSLEGIEYIRAQLVLGNPVLIGVSYWSSSYNEQNSSDHASSGGDADHSGESRVDHFVTIIGVENDKFIFNDPGSQWVANMQNQHFVVDSDSILVRDQAEVDAGAKPYEVSQIRRNS